MTACPPPASAFDSPAICPRCGIAFPCGAGRPIASPCACTGVSLEPGQRAALAERWSTCVCPACLRDVAAGQRP